MIVRSVLWPPLWTISLSEACLKGLCWNRDRSPFSEHQLTSILEEALRARASTYHITKSSTLQLQQRIGSHTKDARQTAQLCIPGVCADSSRTVGTKCLWQGQGDDLMNIQVSITWRLWGGVATQTPPKYLAQRLEWARLMCTLILYAWRIYAEGISKNPLWCRRQRIPDAKLNGYLSN